MNFDKGFIEAEEILSNLWLSGDIRDISILNFKSGTKRIVVSRNDDKVGVYSFTKRKL